MKIIENEQVIFCDVDETLVLHDQDTYTIGAKIVVTDPYCGTLRTLTVHQPHVQLLRERAKRGAHIKVMSAGGYQWAEAVVKALQLEDCVAECLSKPIAIIDDLPIEAALGQTMYLRPDSRWKNNHG